MRAHGMLARALPRAVFQQQMALLLSPAPRQLINACSYTACGKLGASLKLKSVDSPKNLRWGGLRLLPSLETESIGITSGFLKRRMSTVPQAVLATPPPKVGASPEIVEQLGFEEVTYQFIDEHNCTGILYRHKKTGAEVISVSTDDENKVFGIILRTPPQDSTGIPHILEHSVLCGSRKYPLKEPFVELLKSSLQTFLNAFTYPDRTCYPVASTNVKDFYNLVDVYLDAVFFPNCVQDVRTFQQEGWHYELNDPSEDITFKGVVFNEMKGVYSQPESVVGRLAQQALFPDNTYSVDSGGDPTVIPSLTFKQFQEFHSKFYHPSNARIWFYGDDDPNERLRILSAYLDLFDANSAAKESEIPLQQLFQEPKKVVEKYAAGDGDSLKKNIVSLNWLLSDKPLDPDTEMALGFLDSLLIDTPAAPLRRALLESRLGDSIIGEGMEVELRQPHFSIGLKGVADENIKKVEDLIFSTLKRLVDEGFTEDEVEATVNTAEFGFRENNTGSMPRGLSLMLRSAAKWLYGQDPFEPLRITKPLKAFKVRIAKEGIKGVFSSLLQQYFLDNPHLVTVELQPDTEKGARDEAAEAERLAKVKASMTQEDLAELTRATEELRLRQETPDSPEALRSVPSLSLEDIPKKPIYVPTAVGELNGTPVLHHDLFTNDVLYSDIAFDLSTVRAELLPLVPLFCQSLLEMGTKDMSFVKLSQLIGQKTGGISVYPVITSVRGKSKPLSCIMVRGKAMAGQTSELFNLFRVVLKEVELKDRHRFRMLASQSRSRIESAFVSRGNHFGQLRMDAKFHMAGWVSEQLGGLSYLEFLRDLEKRVDDAWVTIAQSLEEIRTALLARKGVTVNLTASEKILTATDKHVSDLLDSFQDTSGEIRSSPWAGNLPAVNEGLVIPTQVNYVGKGANLYENGYKLHGSSYVVCNYLATSWLWDRIRVSGGAYGAFCDFDTRSGVFSYQSYRDPNLMKTLDNYDGTVDFLTKLELDKDTLTKSIIGAIGEVDSYQLPDAKGYGSFVRYLVGITEEERERIREEILSTSVEDFRNFGGTLEAVRDKGIVVAVASANDIAAANVEIPNFLTVKKVL